MKKHTKKILGIGSAVAGGVGITAGVASHVVTKYLVRIALDREIPEKLQNNDKAKKQLRGFVETQDFFDELRQSAKKLESQTCETVEIVSHDGERLVGHWFPTEHAKRTIIAMHGWRSSWSSDFGMIADFWHSQDCNVLYAEQRGQGSSGGEYMGFGLLERFDCLDWIDWVNVRLGTGIPVYLGGVSMGATTVLMAAGLTLPENVHGIIADCGFTSAHAIWKHVAENNLHIHYGIRAAAANDLCKKRIQIGTNEYTTMDALKECQIPVLFIHGTDDTFVPVEMTYENYKSCKALKKLFVVPGADHGMSYYVDKDGYEAAVKDFWGNYDG